MCCHRKLHPPLGAELGVDGGPIWFGFMSSRKVETFSNFSESQHFFGGDNTGVEYFGLNPFKLKLKYFIILYHNLNYELCL